jgi:hypothetical protein
MSIRVGAGGLQLKVVAESGFESGAKRAHSRTLARFIGRFKFRKVLECVRFAPLF